MVEEEQAAALIVSLSGSIVAPARDTPPQRNYWIYIEAEDLRAEINKI